MALPSVQRTFLKSIASPDPEGLFIEVNGILTFYRIAIPQIHQQLLQNQQPIPNEPNKPVILLLHQTFGNLYTWRHIMQPLANATGCHVIAYDRPTFGLTERPTKWEEGKNPYTQEAAVDFAIQFVTNLGYGKRKLTLVGVSSGGGISCAIAIKYPNLVHSLCLIAPGIRAEDQGPPPIGRYILASAPGRLYLKFALYQNIPNALFYHNINSIPEFETVVKPSYQVPLTLPNFYESFSWLMKYFVPLNILPNKNILTQVPILYISGDDDKYLHVDNHQKVFNEIASTSPNTKMEFKVINECGHLPQDEKPQDVLNFVINFLLSIY